LDFGLQTDVGDCRLLLTAQQPTGICHQITSLAVTGLKSIGVLLKFKVHVPQLVVKIVIITRIVVRFQLFYVDPKFAVSAEIVKSRAASTPSSDRTMPYAWDLSD
jgi:hypothetical protein